MELIKILEEQILHEGRLEDVIETYGGEEENAEKIRALSQQDPSGNNKYLAWMTNQVIINKYDIDSVVRVVTEFNDVLNKITPEVVRDVFQEDDPSEKTRKILAAPTDINVYDDIKDLSKVVDLAKQMLSRREVKKLAKSEAETIYEDDVFEIIVPRTYRASCHYGTGTKWCVTQRNSDSYFNEYTGKGVLFFILDKRMRAQADHPLYKIAVHYPESGSSPQIYNALDKTIGQNKLENIFPPRMADVMKKYMNNRKVVFTILDNNLLTNVTIKPKDENWEQMTQGVGVINRDTGCTIQFKINTKKNEINSVFVCDNQTIKNMKDNIDIGFIKSVYKKINYDNETLDLDPETQKSINKWFSEVVDNAIYGLTENTLNMVKTGQILNKMVRTNNNEINGGYDGDWIFEIKQQPTSGNPIAQINVNWPDDPDDDVLHLYCSIMFNVNTFKLEGILNPGTSSRSDYDEETIEYDHELNRQPEELVNSFISWIRDKMTELLAVEGDEEEDDE